MKYFRTKLYISVLSDTRVYNLRIVIYNYL